MASTATWRGARPMTQWPLSVATHLLKVSGALLAIATSDFSYLLASSVEWQALTSMVPSQAARRSYELRCGAPSDRLARLAHLTDAVQLRLEDGDNKYSGRLEVFFNNSWGRVRGQGRSVWFGAS